METCKKCGRPSLQRSTSKYALGTYEMENGGANVNPTNFMPLEAYICASCDDVTFKLIRS